MNKVFYYHGKQALLDILNYRILRLKKLNSAIRDLINHYKKSEVPKIPISADLLMRKYKLSEGKQLGKKLKIIEEEWVKNSFKISDQQVENIINN